MKRSSGYVVVLLALLVLFQHMVVSQVQAASSNGSDNGNDDTERVEVSQSCAAALLSASGIFGATASALVANAALPLMGFTATGVQGGSFAAWWQSTMPLVAKGSIFASLQSIAMTGAGATAGPVMIGAALGGAGGAAYIEDFCAYVDQVEPESVVGSALSANLKFVQSTVRGVQGASEYLEPHLGRVVKFVEPYLEEMKAFAGQSVKYMEPHLEQAKEFAGKTVKYMEPHLEQAKDLAGQSLKYMEPHLEHANDVAEQSVKYMQPHLEQAKDIAGQSAEQAKQVAGLGAEFVKSLFKRGVTEAKKLVEQSVETAAPAISDGFETGAQTGKDEKANTYYTRLRSYLPEL